MKRIFALLLALLMCAGLLAGCGNGEENPQGEPTQSGDPTTAPSYEAPTETNEPDEIELPLTDDSVSFDYWLPSSSSFEDFNSYDDNTFYQWMEEQTGVHLNFMHPAGGSERENFQTMVLSADYPDFIQSIKNYYDGGVDKAISDGVILALNDYVDEFMPHYRAKVYETEEIFIQSISDQGNLWGVHCILSAGQGAWIGLGIREDWLGDAGMTLEDVHTIQGYHDALVAFKNYTYDGAGPLELSSGGFQNGGGVNGSWNVTSVNFNNSGIMNVNGTATYSPLAPGFKEYVGTMAEWYAEGLINTNYVADAAFAIPEDRWVNSEVGSGEFIYTMADMFAASAATSELQPDPDFSLVAIATPKQNASDDWATDYHVRNGTPERVNPGNSMGISTQCSDVELACRYWDYVWSNEGIHAANWGQIEGAEGDTNAHYYVDPTDANGDGNLEVYQPWMMEKYQNPTYIQTKFCVHNGPTYCIFNREWCVTPQRLIDFTTTWNEVGADYMWPASVTLTADEGASASGILANCNTAVNEWIASVITGAQSVDTYDTLVGTIQSMNIEEAVGYYQAALSRYSDRRQYLD